MNKKRDCWKIEVKSMIRIALVEDDEAYREELAEYLRRYEKESGQQFLITAFGDGDEILSGYKAEYDLILMDIAMPFVDGMTAAEQIRTMDSEAVIIFLTSMPQYAMKGYSGAIPQPRQSTDYQQNWPQREQKPYQSKFSRGSKQKAPKAAFPQTAQSQPQPQQPAAQQPQPSQPSQQPRMGQQVMHFGGGQPGVRHFGGPNNGNNNGGGDYGRNNDRFDRNDRRNRFDRNDRRNRFDRNNRDNRQPRQPLTPEIGRAHV